MRVRNSFIRFVKNKLIGQFSDYNPLNVEDLVSDLVFIDVGCRNGPDPYVTINADYYFGFDADVNEINRLSKKFNGDEKFFFEHKFIGEDDKKIDYYVHEDGNYSGAVINSEEKVQLHATSLDNALNMHLDKLSDKFVVLDIDTEGYSLEVLKSAIGTLPYVSVVSVEVFNRVQAYDFLGDFGELLSFMHKGRFKLLSLSKMNHKNDIVVPNGINLCDCVFVSDEVYESLLQGNIPDQLYKLFGVLRQDNSRSFSYYVGSLLIALGVRLKLYRGANISDRNYPI